MRASQHGIDFIKGFEGLRLAAYKPVPTEKFWTIGYGHYGADVHEGEVITRAQAEQLISRDVEERAAHVSDLIKVSVNQNQFDALVSFAYNLGVNALATSTLLEYVNKGNFNAAAGEFGKWIHSDGEVLAGLVRRRRAEMELFLTPCNNEGEKDMQEPAKSANMYRLRKGNDLRDTQIGTIIYEKLKDGYRIESLPDDVQLTNGKIRLVAADGTLRDTDDTLVANELIQNGYLVAFIK